MLSYRRLNVLS